MSYFINPLKSIIIIAGFLSANLAGAQTSIKPSLTGTWEGIFFSDMDRVERKKFFLHIELKQVDRKVDGYFSTAQLSNPEVPEVVYKISGILNKKMSLDLFTLLKDDIVANTIAYGIANDFREFNCTHITKDSANYIYGNWLPTGPSRRADGAGGSYQVKQVDTTTGQLYSKYKK